MIPLSIIFNTIHPHLKKIDTHPTLSSGITLEITATIELSSLFSKNPHVH